MASGRSHSLATLTAATCFAVVASVNDNPALYWTAAGAFAGLVLTPDLDQDGAVIADFLVRSLPDFIREIFPFMDKPVNYLGFALGKVWGWYSWLYGWLFSHRSFWTHFPVVGTVIRIAYFLWPFYAFDRPLYPAFINGLVAVDAAHYLMDLRLFRRIFTQ